MALITISYLESLLGSDIATDDEPRVTRYIEIVSAFIESYTGVTFSLNEDQVVKAVADGKGIIEIEDLSDVSLVEVLDGVTNTWSDVNSSLYFAFNSGYYGYRFGHYGFGYDGISKVYGLVPGTTYRITCTYGQATVPKDIQGVAGLLVLAGAGLDYTAVNGLRAYRVGDVEETYGVTSGAAGDVITLDSMMAATLNAYCTGNTTYRV